MLFVVWAPLLLQLMAPLALLAWLAFGRPRSRAEWLLRVGFVASYILAVGMAGLWLVLPWYTPVIYCGLFLLAAASSLAGRRALPRWPSGRRSILGAALTGILAAASAGVALYVVSGRRSPSDAVEVAFPLRGGTYLVVNGGGNSLINAHLKTLEGERFRPWRGQSYGVDIAKLDRLGLRARGMLPRDLEAYAIFGEPVHAPCAGEVVAAVDGVREMTPPQMDREHMAGNHVILQCGDMWILLGHLQHGSVGVGRGERLETGHPVGRVGNTGNTGEPHLHIHAQRAGNEHAPLSGEPLSIRFGAGYPVRNQRINAPRAE
jgi:hypothetical protein